MEYQDYLDYLKALHCTRGVPFDPYERKDEQDAVWWEQTCRALEAERDLPEDQRQDVIWSMFPHSLAENILRILGHDPQNLNNITPTNSDVDRLKHRIHRVKSGRREYFKKGQGFVSASTIAETDLPVSRNAGPRNPYKRFFLRNEDRVAIWRTLPPLKLEEMDMTQKSEAITELIATDFVEWLISIGGENKSNMDVETIKKMFEIGFQSHAATSLCVRVREMPSVPEAVAKAHNEPHQSITARLHQQLKRDVERTKGKTKMFAFGTMLPKELRHKPPTDNVTEKWVRGNKIPEELNTMEAVWEGIINLRSTKAFCAWIMSHPNIPHPQYLKSQGMLTYDLRKYSVDSKESYDPNYGKPVVED